MQLLQVGLAVWTNTAILPGKHERGAEKGAGEGKEGGERGGGKGGRGGQEKGGIRKGGKG